MKLDIENLDIISDRYPRVYIANQSGHDFSDSERYGTPVFVTKGLVNRFSVNFIARKWALSLSDSTNKDYILVTSLTILTVIGAALFGHLHGCINLLLYRNERYIARRICFTDLLKSLTEGTDEEEDKNDKEE
jgi:hypothetical protein